MKLNVLLAIVFSLLFVNLSFAQIPSTMNYQGFLTDAAGVPLPDGNYDLTFSIYDVDAGGAALWAESQVVALESGIFNAILGNSAALNLDFNIQYWMGIQVAADPELIPRIELTSSAYTFNSKNTEAIAGNIVNPAAPTSGDVLKWDGAAWAPGSDNAGSTIWATNGSNVYYDSGYVGIGTSSPGTGLHLESAAGYGSGIGLNNTGGGLEWRLTSWTDGTFRVVKSTGTTFSPIVIEPVDGHIGIGTSTPNQLLSVHSNSGISYIRVSDNTSGPGSGLRLGMSGSGNAYIINDEAAKSLSLGTDGTTQLRITDIGHIGINVLSPTQLLHLRQDAANRGFRIQHESNTNYWDNGIGTTTMNYKFYYNNLFRADISAVDGAYTQSSDRRLKKNIQDLEPVMEKVSQLKPSTFQYLDNSGLEPSSTGFIAQDIEQLFPNLVRETDDGYKGVIYDGFAVIAIKAIQEQQKIIEELKLRIEDLERR